MLRVVADTNILVSAVLTEGKPRQFLRRSASGEWTLVTSPVLLEEFVEVRRRPKFRMTEDQVQRALAALVETADVVRPQTAFHLVEDDPDDDSVLDAAYEGRADFIVSGDRHLLDLGNFREIPILNVSEFLAKVDG